MGAGRGVYGQKFFEDHTKVGNDFFIIFDKKDDNKKRKKDDKNKDDKSVHSVAKKELIRMGYHGEKKRNMAKEKRKIKEHTKNTKRSIKKKEGKKGKA